MGFTLTSGNIVDRSGSGTSTLSALSFTATAGSVDIGLVGDGTLTKTGAGTVVLNGSNAYSGLTTVVGGILVINGKNSGIGDTLVSAGTLQLGSSGAVASRKISVSDGGMLTGFGYAHSVIDLDGGISPGLLSERVGTLNTGAQTWGSTGTYYWDITNVNGAAGTDWDLLNLNGNALVIQSGFTLRVIGLLDPATGFDSTKSYGWLIAANLTSVTGVDEAIRIMLNDAQDSRFTLRGDFQTNGLYLDFTPVPEPAHYAMILAAATVGLVGYRRWRRTERLA